MINIIAEILIALNPFYCMLLTFRFWCSFVLTNPCYNYNNIINSVIFIFLERGAAGPSWWCSNNCRPKAAKDKHDYVQAYQRALGFRGLLDMVVRDGVREGDGPQINSEWRLSMVEYANLRHHRYLVIGHNLLAGLFLIYAENSVKAWS